MNWTLNMFADKQQKGHKNESKWWRENRQKTCAVQQGVEWTVKITDDKRW
jgi:hypothetical protein